MTAHYHDLAEKADRSLVVDPSAGAAPAASQSMGQGMGSATATLGAAPSHLPADLDWANFQPYRHGVKRALDILAVLLALPVVVPLVLLLALLVACDGGRPMYRQKRVGRGGRHYTMWKLRSMVVDADEKLDAYLADNPLARAEWETTQKLKRDPRITRFGRVLRKCSFDELPQLWNVLIGDMSLVGPRPMMVDQQPLYPGRAYYTLRPGITGIWQVSQRNQSSFADRARFDAQYAREVSFMTDTRLLLATVQVVFRGTGY